MVVTFSPLTLTALVQTPRSVKEPIGFTHRGTPGSALLACAATGISPNHPIRQIPEPVGETSRFCYRVAQEATELTLLQESTIRV